MTSLDMGCLRAIAAGYFTVVLASLDMAALRGATSAAAFLPPALLAWAAVAETLWRARGGAPYAATRLGIANQLTLARGLLVSLVAGFALVTPSGAVAWMPFVLYTAAAILDRVDGIVARRRGQVSALGVRLDEATDALGLLVAPLVAVVWRRLPPWYLLVGVAYYLYRAGLWWRHRIGLPVYLDRVTSKPATRFFAGAQMVLVCAALPPLLGRVFTTVAATLLMIPTLVLFGRDWLIVTGRRPPPGATVPSPPRSPAPAPPLPSEPG